MVFMKNKPKILTFVSYYLPGYKAGGPLRTIANMVDHLSNDFEFWIVTRDRDLGDEEPYTDINVNQWNDIQGAKVFYLSPENQTLSGITDIINATPHDLIYLNSFFDPLFTLQPLLARRLGRLKNAPVLLAPRGEFSEGAIQLKRFKKSIFMKVARWLGIYNGIYWHASSTHEVEDIKREFRLKGDSIVTALDLPAKISEDNFLDSQSDRDHEGLHIIFLSRIAPMKNLDYALRLLKQVTARVKLDIYGPIEDKAYWELCKGLIGSLPANIDVNYLGLAHPDDVAKTFAQYDLFLFPTRGENYGHVIAESLSVGTPVLISDQTPWKDLESDGLGWDISLDNTSAFINVIERMSLRTSDEKYQKREYIRQKVLERLTSPELLESNRQVFNIPLKNKNLKKEK
ncbi:MAG: glycosyltransferase [Campylobacterales bacterium]|nr:glycosyltransferase [Campylobacterales bacterium]